MTLRPSSEFLLEFPYCFSDGKSGISACRKTPNVPQNRPFFMPESHPPSGFGSSQK